MKAFSSAQMRELEQKAVLEGISYNTLMERAGCALADCVQRQCQNKTGSIVILCGKGNNGGDGFVSAKQLAISGSSVSIILVDGLPQTKLAQEVYGKLNEIVVPVCHLQIEPDKAYRWLHQADIIVDCIYGIGFYGQPSKEIAKLLKTANASKALRIAADLPSGINCDIGTVSDLCFKADITVTFTALKPAHVLFPTKTLCGKIELVDVGIPEYLTDAQPAAVGVLTECSAEIFSPRDTNSHKGNYGYLLCVCGSMGMSGAAVMCAKAALRCGTGIVHLALSQEIYPIVAGYLPEPIYTVLQQPCELEELLPALQKATACVIGCGLGTTQQSRVLLEFVLQFAQCPLVLDADALNLLAATPELLKTAAVPIVLTPHPGEMARLCKTTVQQVQANRLQIAQSFAIEHRVTVVLKGAGTVIAGADGSVAVNTTGNAGMAKGGSGDVLAGMIGALLAQGQTPEKAAETAVWIHGRAGDCCAQRLSQTAMLPTDLLDTLPQIFLEMEKSGDII